MTATERLLMRVREIQKHINEGVVEAEEEEEEEGRKFVEEIATYDDETGIKELREIIDNLLKHAEKLEENEDAAYEDAYEVHGMVIDAIDDYELAKSIGE